MTYRSGTIRCGTFRAWLLKLTLLGILVLAPFILPTWAADHSDGTTFGNDQAADIADLYAWMNPDGSTVNLALTVFPFAGANPVFPTNVQYVFHIQSKTAYGAAAATDLQIICQFYTPGKIECWGPSGEYVEGSPISTRGLTSESGKMMVFAAWRDDPFFFELNGFNAAVKAVVDALPSLSGSLDGDGCPTGVDTSTSEALVAQLQAGPLVPPDGGPDAAALDAATTLPPASDTLAGQNVLALVVKIDKALLTTGGNILSVWGATRRPN